MGIELNNEQIFTVYKCENWFRHSSQQVFEIAGAAGTGKAQPIDTIIPTPNGNKKLGELSIGDYVFNKKGKPVKILGVFDQGLLDTYQVTLSDGRQTLCNNEHLWTVKHFNEYKTLTLQEMIDRSQNSLFEFYYVPSCGPVEYQRKNYDIDPYTIGKESIDVNIIKEYITGNISQRIDLIRGIFSNRYYNIDIAFDKLSKVLIRSYNKELIEIIKNIFRSLGYIPYTNNVVYVESSSLDKEFVDYYGCEVYMSSYSIKQIFLNDNYIYKGIPLWDQYNEKLYPYITSIEKLENKSEMRCIYIDDPEHLYLTNDYIVTHNTTIVLYLIEQLGLNMNEVLFLAYQGKAACRLTMTGLPAKTIHSAIYHYEKEPMKDENGSYLRNDRGKIRMKGVFKKRDYIGEKENIKLIVVDEAGMVNKEIAEDLKSFNIPIIVLGDLNQLPPVFGNAYFLTNPDVVLTKIMRQNEGNPIVYLSQQILAGNKLNIGIYGKSEVIPKSELLDSHFSKSDIVLSETNRLRWNVNNFFREQLRKYKQLDYPHTGEKIICRKNNWKRSIDGGIFLTNGMSGYVDSIQKWSFNSKDKTMVMDFKPDFTSSIFKDVKFNYEFMFSAPISSLEESEDSKEAINDYFNDRFEFGYCITTHLSQGSQYNKVLYLNENIMRTKEDQKKLTYTAITRAIDSITIVI